MATPAIPPGVRRRERASAARPVWAFVAVGAAGLAALAAVGVVDPGEPGHYPSCPVFALTGLFCPGCGSLRAMHALVHGDLATAWARNPLTVPAFAVLLGAYLEWGQRVFTGAPRRVVAPPWLLWTLLGFVVAFTLLRNVPGFDALSPR